MIKKCLLLVLVLLTAGQLLVAQSFKMITLSADGEETSYVLSDVQKIVFDNNTMTVKMKTGEDATNITSISFAYNLSEIDYSKLKLNEVSGVGNDPDKFYELINTGDIDIPLEGCQIIYNAAPLGIGDPFPPDREQLTWTGASTQIAQAGKLFSLIGRNNQGSFTTGLTASRILIITLKDPFGNTIDQCLRAQDTGDYEINDKSFSRIPDGTGPFYFTKPTPDEFNGTDATGLLLVPQTQTGIKDLKVESSIFVFPNPVKEYITLKGAKKGAIINLYDFSGKLLQTLPAEENSTTINVSSLSQGTYLLSVEEQTIKFIKNKNQ